MEELRKKRARGTKSRWRLLSLVALLALGTVGIGATSAVAAGPSVPFESSVSGTVSQTGELTFALEGSAISSHLGTTGYEGEVEITGVDSDGVITDTLTETLTAANGDTLTLLCFQVAVPIGPGMLHGTDQWTVIDGTGRFSGATGSGTGDTYVDLNSGTFTKELTGTITVGS
jgi:hypothetical protein